MGLGKIPIVAAAVVVLVAVVTVAVSYDGSTRVRGWGGRGTDG